MLDVLHAPKVTWTEQLPRLVFLASITPQRCRAPLCRHFMEALWELRPWTLVLTVTSQGLFSGKQSIFSYLVITILINILLTKITYSNGCSPYFLTTQFAASLKRITRPTPSFSKLPILYRKCFIQFASNKYCCVMSFFLIPAILLVPSYHHWGMNKDNITNINGHQTLSEHMSWKKKKYGIFLLTW